MFTRLKNRVLTAVSPDLPALPLPNLHHSHGSSSNNKSLPEKFTYARPSFLQLMTFDELKASADHNVRPIIVPRDTSIMPLSTGYAECVNSGKSEWNEDQGAFRREILSHPSKLLPDLPYIYFGIFDGHAGYGAALAAGNQFHHILHEKLVDVLDHLLPKPQQSPVPVDKIYSPLMFYRNISKDELIIGALEAAFLELDTVLVQDRDIYRNAGGCTALVSLFIFGKLFVANAGDSRAIVSHRLTSKMLKENLNIVPPHLQQIPVEKSLENKPQYIFPVPYSHDHTPDTERTRLMSVANLNPSYMGYDYIAMEYAKKPLVKDLGTRILYRKGIMKGWAYKTLTREDLKMPIVTGEGKRSRLLGTIGVTRGFGDHDLRALGSGVLIKPFLSAHPEVIFRDLTKIVSSPDNEDGDYGLLVMATDGLWDVADSENVSQTVFKTLDKYAKEKHKYTMIAQELVAKSRGRINESGHWRLTDSKAAATVDDISVLVIPIYQYYKEYNEWEKQFIETKLNGRMSNGRTEEPTDSTEEIKPNLNTNDTLIEVKKTNDKEECDHKKINTNSKEIIENDS